MHYESHFEYIKADFDIGTSDFMTCATLLPRHVAHGSMVSLLPLAGRFCSPHLALRSTPIISRRALVVTAGFQGPLTSAERKAKRADAQRLGKAIVLQQLGMKGITPAFVQGLCSALVANELVKVRSNAPLNRIYLLACTLCTTPI